MITHQLPVKINNVTGEESTWASIRQPYVFKFYRKDATYASVSSITGNKIRLNTPTLNGYTLTIGETITIVDDATNKKRTGKITSFAVGNIDTDIDAGNGLMFIGSGYINFQRREDYKINLFLTATIPSINETIELGTLTGSPDGYGVCKIDVQQILTTYCEKTYRFIFGSAIAQKDYSGYISFVIAYNDQFYFNNVKSNTIANRVDVSKNFYGIDGVKPLLSVYGQNYSNYISATSTGYPAKFLSCFERPVLFLGEPYPSTAVVNTAYPFTLQAIIPDAWKNISPYLFTQGIQVDGTLLQMDASAIPQTTKAINHFLIYEGQVVAANIALLNVWLQTSVFYSEGTTPANYFIDDFPEKKEYPSTVVLSAKTEVKQLIVDSRCRNYPVYLTWKNSIGGWDFWLFDKINETNITASQGERYDVYVENIEVAQFNNRIIQGSGVKTITVGDLIDTEHIEGLSEIERSAAVFMLYDRRKLTTLNPQLAWLGVQIAPKGLKFKSNANKTNVELTIVLPDYYTTPN